eukprot:Plantae.Rhodophyta-Hildenbrandia_rubra.ctg511.p1 GENE.Plantae.Rhodophyta-Hildenbrandia_rubra.ctg511~~Plantae.Rhodophyta-Hildenbrandia_rubra.ctg511.p1  ORF type:complete len:273 (-),score=45.33 Plantae.Rhodophyta-Hildenbrandia_rubra.ctg511:2642-3460(-)
MGSVTTTKTSTQINGNPFSSPPSAANGYDPVESNPFEIGIDDGTEGGGWETEASGVRSEKRFYEVGYYATYFDVDVSDILRRLARSLIPFDRLFREGDGGGDLYGPFWITATAVLALSVGREFGEFVRGLFKKKEVVGAGEIGRLWRCAGVLYGYVLVFPVVLLLLQCLFARNTLEGARRSGGGVFLGTVAVYGYSLTPVCVGALVAAVPIKIVQISAMIVAFVLGGLVIMINLWRDVSIGNSSLAYFIRLLAVLAHCGVGASVIFLFYLQR